MADNIVVAEHDDIVPVESPGEARDVFFDARTDEIARCLELDSIRKAARRSARTHVVKVLTAGDPESSLEVVMEALTRFRSR